MKNTQEPHNDFKINNNINLHHTSWVKLHPHFSLNANGSAMTPSIYFLLNFHNTSSVHDFVIMSMTRLMRCQYITCKKWFVLFEKQANKQTTKLYYSHPFIASVYPWIHLLSREWSIRPWCSIHHGCVSTHYITREAKTKRFVPYIVGV